MRCRGRKTIHGEGRVVNWGMYARIHADAHTRQHLHEVEDRCETRLLLQEVAVAKNATHDVSTKVRGQGGK